jgi:hypothetical protein
MSTVKKPELCFQNLVILLFAESNKCGRVFRWSARDPSAIIKISDRNPIDDECSRPMT